MLDVGAGFRATAERLDALSLLTVLPVLAASAIFLRGIELRMLLWG